MGMVGAVQGVAIAGQLLLLACAYMPGTEEPSRGAMMLISLFFCGLNIGAGLGRALARRRGEA